MSAKHFVIWAEGGRTHVATLSSYRRGEASWRCDDARFVPAELVEALGYWEWQTPVNGPFPAFQADRLLAVASWLKGSGYSAGLLQEPPR